MNFPTSKKSVSVKLLVALGAMGAAGVASASYSSTQAATVQPNNQTDLVKGVITTTGVNTAATIANTVSGIVGGGVGGPSFAALPAGITRFALPGQGGTGAAAAPRPRAAKPGTLGSATRGATSPMNTTRSNRTVMWMSTSPVSITR
jgi:hypothetical protein